MSFEVPDFTIPENAVITDCTRPSSEHFTFDELIRSDAAAAHGLINEPPTSLYPNLRVLLHFLEVIRYEFNKPIKITSGYRSEAVNRLVNGASNSQHLFGRAADITSPYLMELYSVVKYLRLPHTYSYCNRDNHYIHFHYLPWL